MLILEAHIMIQQELQNLNSFANLDMWHDEVDRALNTSLLTMIEEYSSEFDALKREKKFEQIQSILDKLDRLYVVDVELTPTQVSNAPFPYYYYDIGAIPSPNAVYRLLDDKSKVTVNCGNTTKNKIVSNILTKSYNLSRTLENSLTKTRKDAPISHYENGRLRVFYNEFTINKLYIDYIKYPRLIHFEYPFSGTSNGAANSTITLQLSSINANDHFYIGMPIYNTNQVLIGTVIAIPANNQIQINALSTAGLNNYVAGLNGDGLMPLSESGNLELVKRTVLYIMKISEQSQQKLVNLSTEIR